MSHGTGRLKLLRSTRGLLERRTQTQTDKDMGFLYIIHFPPDPHDIVKLGSTGNLADRKRSYITARYMEPVYKYAFEVEVPDLVNLEHRIHDSIDRHRIAREFFRMTPDDLRTAVRTYLQEAGVAYVEHVGDVKVDYRRDPAGTPAGAPAGAPADGNIGGEIDEETDEDAGEDTGEDAGDGADEDAGDDAGEDAGDDTGEDAGNIQLLEDDEEYYEDPDIVYGDNDCNNNLVKSYGFIRRADGDKALREYMYDYQRNAVDAFVKGTTMRKGIFEIFCGLGKSLISYAIHRLNDFDDCLFVFPSVDLIYQYLNEYVYHPKWYYPAKILVLCSKKIRHKQSDITITTDKAVVDGWFRQNKKDEVRRLVFSTYQSLKLVDLNTFELCLFDEAHNICTANRAFLYENKEHKNTRLYFTATVRKEKRVSMLDRETFGDVLYSMNAYTGIQQGFINDYDLLCSLYGNTDDPDVRTEKLIDAICRCMVKYKRTKVLVFHRFYNDLDDGTGKRRGSSAKRFSSDTKVRDLFESRLALYDPDFDKGAFRMVSLSGKDSANTRKDEFARFVAGTGYNVICNVNVLKEGINLPNANMCVFMDPKKAPRMIIQNIGRIIRKNREDGLNSLIMVPLLVGPDEYAVDETVMVDRLIKVNRFAPITNIANALKTIDERLYNFMYNLAGVRKDITFDAEVDIKINDREALVRLMAGRYNQDPFAQWVERYRAFVAEKGRIPTSSKKDEEGRLLAIWMTQRRRAYRKGILTADQIRILESLDHWTWDHKGDQINLVLNRYKQFVAEHKRLPMSSSEGAERKLAIWTQQQRMTYNQGKLTENRIKLLESLDLWTWDVNGDRFKKMIDLYEKFVGEHGWIPSCVSKDSHEKELGTWVVHHRRYYKTGTLNAETIKLLESLPMWSWDPFGDKYQEMVEKYKEFVQSNNRLPNKRAVGEERSLGQWIIHQRGYHKREKLDTETVKLLESLPMWSWAPDADQFEKTIVWYRQYVAENGRLPRQSQEDSEVKQLTTWIGDLRKKYKKGTLPDDLKARLETLPIWSWDVIDDSYNRTAELYKKFISEHDRQPSKKCTTDIVERKLGTWVGTLRKKYNKGNLDEEIIKMCEALPDWKWKVPRKIDAKN